MRRSCLSRSTRRMRPYAPGFTPPARRHAPRPLQSRSKAAAGQRYLSVPPRSASKPWNAIARTSPVSGQTQDTALVVNDDIGAVGEQRPRDQLLRVIAPASRPISRVSISGRAAVPQPRLQPAIVETAVGAEVGAAPSPVLLRTTPPASRTALWSPTPRRASPRRPPEPRNRCRRSGAARSRTTTSPSSTPRRAFTPPVSCLPQSASGSEVLPSSLPTRGSRPPS